MTYELQVTEHPKYVHVHVSGERTPENARRAMRDAYEACMRAGRDALLLEMRFSGESLDLSRIFGVISDRAADGMKLSRIAYVEASPGGKEIFAETVARNRGVNVRLFREVRPAAAWLVEG